MFDREYTRGMWKLEEDGFQVNSMLGAQVSQATVHGSDRGSEDDCDETITYYSPSAGHRVSGSRLAEVDSPCYHE